MSETKPKATVLVVEDEGIIAMDLQSTLIGLGYHVPETVDTGEDAISIASELRPDLVLMDIHLKGEMDGVEAAQSISTNLNIPIVFLTANADDGTLSRAKLTGPFGYLLKPFEERELHTTIDIALYKSQLECRLREQKQWLSTVLKSIGDGVIVNDINANVNFMNPVAESVTEWTQTDAVGQHLDDVINLYHADTFEPAVNPAVSALETGTICHLEENIILRSKTGHHVPIEDSAAPIIDEKGTIKGSVMVFRDITERKKIDEQLIRHAFYDSLTDLPNRALFMNRLVHILEHTKRYPAEAFALLFVDVDRFKLVNDSLGHMVGDQLLVKIADRLKDCLRTNDTVARFGGDEFAILLERITDVSTACMTAERIINSLSKPFMLNGQEVFSSASIGIVISAPNYTTAVDLLRDADIAMYRAKSSGKSCYEVFDRKMFAEVRDLLNLESELRRAVTDQEFLVYYQPIVSLETKAIAGFEALVRWKHPQRGVLSPYSFISIAEEMGIIVLIDWWVLEEACRQVKAWQQLIPVHPPLYISVNISALQFSHPQFVARVKNALEQADLPAHCLKLEITESAIIDNPEAATDILKQLKHLGIQIYIDDFGTGYSSLSYLSRFPIDTLKIDRSFITNMSSTVENSEIVRAIVTLAKTLHMTVVAEGVETLQQLDAVNVLNCEYGQGYFFSQPLDYLAAEKILCKQY